MLTKAAFKLIVTAICLTMPMLLFAGTTGKISGKILDSETGDPLPGVNVLIEGTVMGAATDSEGDYFIINVPPGRYNMIATMIGYESIKQTAVDVMIDRTVVVNFKLKTAAITGEEVVVEAQKEIVRQDVSHSEISISSEVATETPNVSSLQDVLLLQPGVEMGGNFGGLEGISIRGGRVEESEFRVDGLSMTDKRRNTPTNRISLTSIQEIQVLTGGFNAEYGDIRSGVVNVVTKSGGTATGSKKINADLIVKYAPPQQKHWGDKYYDYSSERSILYPYLGPQAMQGFTYNGVQIWEGWNSWAAKQPENSPYYNNPELAKSVYAYEHRPQPYMNNPDINIDGTITGSVPFLKKTNFMISTVYDQVEYPMPAPRDVQRDYTTNLKLMFKPMPSLDIMLNAEYGELNSMSSSFKESTLGSYWAQENPIQVFQINDHMFNQGGQVLVDHFRRRYSLKATKIFSNSTFMEFTIQRIHNNYYANTMRLRDTTTTTYIGPVGLDERPYGYWGATKEKDILNMWYVTGQGQGRDNSYLKSWSGKAFIVSQINKHNQIKAGIDFDYSDIHNRSGLQRMENNKRSTFYFDAKPVLASAYMQDKLEFEGLIANVGVRLDYSKATDQWFLTDDPYADWFGRGMVYWTENSTESTVDSFWVIAPKSKVKAKIGVSPRLGISHPLSQNSKIFFNYGHFYQRANFGTLFRSHWRGSSDGDLQELGNPNADFEKTVAYELGFEQNLFNMFSLRLAGYYKDITNELITISYNGTGKISYDTYQNNGYRDIRGFEFSLEKRVGRYLTGFFNYDYRVDSEGRIGPSDLYQDPSLAPRIYDPEQKQPVATPRFRASLNLHTPQRNFGPQILGGHPLSYLTLNVLFKWEAGDHFTYNPENRPGVENNMQWVDYHNTDLRISKGFNMMRTRTQLFLEFRNLFNNKFILLQQGGGSIPQSEWETYLASLKPGDRVGEYNKDYLILPRYEQYLFNNQPRQIWFGMRLGI